MITVLYTPIRAMTHTSNPGGSVEMHLRMELLEIPGARFLTAFYKRFYSRTGGLVGWIWQCTAPVVRSPALAPQQPHCDVLVTAPMTTALQFRHLHCNVAI